MSIVSDVVSFLSSDVSAEAVASLACEVSISKAVRVCSAWELRHAEQIGDDQWINMRGVEYERRVAQLREFVGDKPISWQLAREIDSWSESNPYSRPHDEAHAEALSQDLAQADAEWRRCKAQLDLFHGVERFGWDYALNCEDEEYAQVLSRCECALKRKQLLRSAIKLVKAGFVADV